MAFYADEEEVWKCLKHPLRRRPCGICPLCLRDRLSALCPNCATERPCACCATTSSSSSSSSSSFSRFSSYGDTAATAAGGVDRVSNLIDSEPAFRRSRSVAIPFLRSRFAAGDGDMKHTQHPGKSSKSSSLWSMFKTQKNKKREQQGKQNRDESEYRGCDRGMIMIRSRSVCAPALAATDSAKSSPAKGRGWHFPSPMKAFRHTKSSKVIQDRSP